MSRFEVQGTGDGWVQVVDTEQQEAVAALSDRYHELADEIRDRLNVRHAAANRVLSLDATYVDGHSYAPGGLIKSPGDPDDNTIGPVLVSRGEHWVTPAMARRLPWLIEMQDKINQMSSHDELLEPGYQRVETRARQIASGAMPSLPWDDLPDSVQNWYRGAARRELYPLARPGPKSLPLPEKIHPHAPTTLELAPDSPEGFAAAVRYKARPPMVWRHCTPWLLETGAVDCGDAERRPCECGLFDLPPEAGHDHLVPEPVALEADALRPGLCDGCDGTEQPVVASDDGRAQFCPTCLPVANSSQTTPYKHRDSWTCGECLTDAERWPPGSRVWAAVGGSGQGGRYKGTVVEPKPDQRVPVSGSLIYLSCDEDDVIRWARVENVTAVRVPPAEPIPTGGGGQ